MIHVNSLKKHSIYYKLKKIPLKPTDLTVMFDYCSGSLWGNNASSILNSFPKDIQERLSQWESSLTNLYLYEDVLDDNILKNLNKEGLLIAKDINNIFDGSVSYIDELTMKRVYFLKN